MEFKGKIGKKGLESYPTKNGGTFKTFSAFSADKDGEKRAFTWVKFTLNQFLDYAAKAGEYVEVHGDLLLDVYKNSLQIGCRVSTICPWDLNVSGNAN